MIAERNAHARTKEKLDELEENFTILEKRMNRSIIERDGWQKIANYLENKVKELDDKELKDDVKKLKDELVKKLEEYKP